MADRIFNVLFLCTGNSARSIIAEVLLARIGKGRFRSFSAGSHPKGAVHPLALELLAERGENISSLRSKAWDEFATRGAPPMDFVFTVCSAAAGEPCPVWPGQPMRAHWGVDDPAAAEGTDDEKRRAFQRAYTELEARIRLFTSLPVETLDRMALEEAVRRIGRSQTSNQEDRMEELSFRERELVALGAALGSNCAACVEFHVGEARRAGLTDREIALAVDLADRIRKVPAAKALAAAQIGTKEGDGAAVGCAPASTASAGKCC